MVTRTSLPWPPPPELLPTSRAAPRDGVRSTSSPPGPVEPLPAPQDADRDAYFGRARTSRAPTAALARTLPGDHRRGSAWAGPADRRALRGALTACRLLDPATASLGIAAAVVSAYGGWAQGRAHQPDRPAGHAAPVDGGTGGGPAVLEEHLGDGPVVLLAPSSEPVAALMSGGWTAGSAG
ncbi:hypothetical protein ACH4JS_20200 [Streptomyces sp. NPDC017638]|uniref:hypothetical protein n=1 Tax=Streptomyces sp. NPDC017638 TaxID=3365004 RepID=UPI003793395E